MLVGSCNDAALALSHFVENQTGQSFVSLMNAQAKILGMQNTSYANAIGFDDQNNFSTAEDLKTLISKTQGFSAFTDLGRRQSYNFQSLDGQNFYVRATNQLLQKNPDLQAIKNRLHQSSR